MEKTINAVIIDDNEVVTGSVKKYFCGNAVINIVGSYSDGKAGLEYLIKYADKYDLVILDVLLPQIDGLRIMEELNLRGIDKKVIVLSSYKDDYTIKRAQTLGADYFMLKPFDLTSLENRIKDVFEKEKLERIAQRSDVEVEISVLLHNLGIPSHVRGYQYIREGILLIYESNKIVTLVTKEIYPKIATKYSTTSSRVERAIRHAIEISWVRGDLKLMEKIFGNSIDFERAKPTNSEFLSTIADRLRLDKKELIA
ncbi:MAG: sporulation transcription factor Spo0A [Bacilli bacterium]|nr:sporulation transcription factor Spo0A [Bacilli bacterium]